MYILVYVQCAARATEPAVLHVDDFIHASAPAQRGVQAAVDAAILSAETRPTALLFAQHEYRLASGNITAHTPVVQVINATGGMVGRFSIEAKDQWIFFL